MTEIQPAHYTQEACHTAQGDRQVFASLVCVEGRSSGVGGEMAVTSGAGLSVDVADGNAFISGTESGWQGTYHVSNDATVNVVLTAADPTDDRIDLIVAQVRDSAYSGANDDWLITKITGTASPAPVAPALTDNTLVLATILVEAGDTSVGSGNITEGDYYQVCSSRQTASLGEVVTPMATGGIDVAVEWTGSNGLTSQFALLSSGGTNNVLQYNGPAGWFMVYGQSDFSTLAGGASYQEIHHYNSAVVDYGDTGRSNTPLRTDTPSMIWGEGSVGSSPLLYLSPGDLITIILRTAEAGLTNVSSQMRVVSI